MRLEERVVAEPVTETEQPDTVVVEVSQASVVVVMVPLVTGEGEHVVNSASDVVLSVQDCVLDEVDVGSFEEEGVGSLPLSLPYSPFFNWLMSILICSSAILMALILASVRPSMRLLLISSSVFPMQRSKWKRLFVQPPLPGGPPLGMIPSMDSLSFLRCSRRTGPMPPFVPSIQPSMSG